MKKLVFSHLITILAVSWLIPADGQAQSSDNRPLPVINVKDYGAVGDGVTDDYAAIRAAAAEINANAGGTLHFPPGTYLIDQYITPTNGIGIAMSNCTGVMADGYGAKIVVKGDFHRPADVSPTESSVNSVIPLHFVNCDDLTIQGFELQGNTQVTTRDPGVIEGQSHGIITRECRNYTIRDVYVHHFSADGIYLGDSADIADRNGLVERVLSSNNARDGLSVISVRDLVIRDSTFENNGWPLGTYPEHGPSCGINVEGSKLGLQDVKTGNILIENCILKDNGKSQFQATGIIKENITIRNCVMDKGISDFANTVNLAVVNGLIENSLMKVNQIVPSWEIHQGTSTTIRNNRIETAYRGITDFVSNAGRTVLIEGNTIIGTHTAPAIEDIPVLQNPSTTFRGNSIFIPAAAKNAQTAQEISRISVALASQNFYRTDYTTTGNQHFYTTYTGTVQTDLEQYPTERFWRRGPNASFASATQLKLTAEPAGGSAGQAFPIQPVVTVQDSSGATNTSYTGPVTLSLLAGTGTPGATLGGSLTVNAVNGVATFSGLSIDQPGSGYVLRAASGTLLVNGTPFNVTAGFTVADLRTVLAANGGLGTVDAAEFTRLNLAQDGESATILDLHDASRLARRISGLD